MITYLTEKAMTWCLRNGRVMNITGTGGPDDIYLVRYYLIRSKWLNVFIHQFLRSDRDDLHDHPWNFVTYLVRGTYTERKWDPNTWTTKEIRRINQPSPPKWWKSYSIPSRKNCLVYRKALDQHQVLTDRPYSVGEKHLAPLTICVTGPTKREWGFIKSTQFQGGQHRRWVPWREYLGLPNDAPGRG